MNKNKLLSGGGENLTGGGKWGRRGREVGGEGEGSGVKGGGKWGLGTPLSTPSIKTPPWASRALFFRTASKESGKISKFLISGVNQDSFPDMMSGFVESTIV